MLKFNEIESILIDIKNLTAKISQILSSQTDNQPEQIKALFESREILIEQTKGFKFSELPAEYSEEQKEHLTSLLESLLIEDKKNLESLIKKVEDTKETLVNLQNQKSVLIYSKS